VFVPSLHFLSRPASSHAVGRHLELAVDAAIESAIDFNVVMHLESRLLSL
jgi:hypothetical protein